MDISSYCRLPGWDECHQCGLLRPLLVFVPLYLWDPPRLLRVLFIRYLVSGVRSRPLPRAVCPARLWLVTMMDLFNYVTHIQEALSAKDSNNFRQNIYNQNLTTMNNQTKIELESGKSYRITKFSGESIDFTFIGGQIPQGKLSDGTLEPFNSRGICLITWKSTWAHRTNLPDLIYHWKNLKL